MKPLYQILTFILIVSPTVQAADKAWNWQEFVQKTREANEDLQSSERSLQASDYSVSGSYSNFYPQVSASVSAGRATTTTETEDYAVTLSASQNLFAGFQDSGKISQAKANFEIAKSSLQSTKAKISYDLKSSLANLQFAQKYLALSSNILNRRELNLKLVQLRFDGGRENRGSLLLSRAYLEEAKLDHLQAEQDLLIAQQQLSKVLGEETSNYSLKDGIPLKEPATVSQSSFQELVLETPSYRTVVAQEELAKAGVTLAEANFYPSLNLSASTSQYGTTWYPDQDRWSVGATLSVPLFNGARDYFATRASLESLRASAFNKGSVQKDVLVRLKDAHVNFVQSVQKLKVDRAYVEAAEVREKISRQKYNNGLSSFDDWDLIETDLIRRQKSLLQSEKDRVILEATWEQVQGKGVL